MRNTHELKCMGHKVSVIIDEDGIEFLGWDEEAEMAVQALGLDPSICWILAQAIENDELDDLLVNASGDGHADIVQILLDAGAEVEAGDGQALRWAAKYGHAAVVQILIEAGAKVRAYDDYALWSAAKAGHAAVVQILLEAGAQVHANTDQALRWAARDGHDAVVQILLNAGADVHANNDQALLWAANFGHHDVVQILEDWIEEHG